MIELLLRDLEDAPHRFYLYGPIEHRRLRAWWSQMPWHAPDDLLIAWEKIGGGDLLDEVTLLGPFPQKSWQDGVEEYNAWHREKGMDHDLFLFSRRKPWSAVHQKTKKILLFADESFTKPREFVSMMAWYIGVARGQVIDSDGLRQIPKEILDKYQGSPSG